MTCENEAEDWAEDYGQSSGPPPRAAACITCGRLASPIENGGRGWRAEWHLFELPDGSWSVTLLAWCPSCRRLREPKQS
jgi:hypothetical protein